MTICHFFNFLQKKVSRLDKKVPAHFSTTLEVVIWKNHVAKPLDSFNKWKKSFCQARTLISAEIWKMTGFYFWANVMLRQPHVRASRAPPAQKSQGVNMVRISPHVLITTGAPVLLPNFRVTKFHLCSDCVNISKHVVLTFPVGF